MQKIALTGDQASPLATAVESTPDSPAATRHGDSHARTLLATTALKAVFIDKDGTLVENVPFNVDPARLALTRHAEEAIRILDARGYLLLVVSNQPGVDTACDRLKDLLPAIDGFYFCPHAPEEGCECRKPASGMLERAAREHGIDLAQSWMVGDILDDIEAGRRAGCRTVLLDNGNETEWRAGPGREPHYVASNLRAAAQVIVAP